MHKLCLNQWRAEREAGGVVAVGIYFGSGHPIKKLVLKDNYGGHQNQGVGPRGESTLMSLPRHHHTCTPTGRSDNPAIDSF